jgi:hypothetical protein
MSNVSDLSTALSRGIDCAFTVTTSNADVRAKENEGKSWIIEIGYQLAC